MALLNNYITHRSTTDLTVADIFRAGWDDYRHNNPVRPDQVRVAGAIIALRQAQDAPAGRPN
jgi:hypothetical protein